MDSNQSINFQNKIDPGLRTLYRILGTSEVHSIMNVLMNESKISVRNLMKKSNLEHRETKFYIVVRELWDNGLIDKEVDELHNVDYSINNFGKELFEKTKILNNIIHSKRDSDQSKLNKVPNAVKSKLTRSSSMQKAFEPTRLEIIKILQQNKRLFFNDILNHFPIPKEDLVDHLKILKKIKIIKTRKIDGILQYSINHEKLNDFYSYIQSNLGVKNP